MMLKSCDDWKAQDASGEGSERDSGVVGLGQLLGVRGLETEIRQGRKWDHFARGVIQCDRTENRWDLRVPLTTSAIDLARHAKTAVRVRRDVSENFLSLLITSRDQGCRPP